MIKLKNLLIESRSKTIELETAIKYVLNIGMPIDDIFHKRHIFRGNHKLSSNFYYMNPKSSIRRSVNTTNYYTLAIDNFPEWKEYPKRSQGIICSNNWNDASEYGNVYRVIPLSENAKIGICPTRDIWNSFSQNLIDINSTIGNGFGILKFHLLTINNPGIKIKNDIELLEKIANENSYTFMDLVHALNLMNKYKNIIWKEFENYNSGIFTKKDNFLKSYENFLDPNKNGFKLETFNTYYSTIESFSEVWFDSECILINEHIISKFEKECKRSIKHD